MHSYTRLRRAQPSLLSFLPLMWHEENMILKSGLRRFISYHSNSINDALAGLLLYLLDVQLRLAQRAQPVQLCSVTATGNRHLAALQLHADPQWKMQPVQASTLVIPCQGSMLGEAPLCRSFCARMRNPL